MTSGRDVRGDLKAQVRAVDTMSCLFAICQEETAVLPLESTQMVVFKTALHDLLAAAKMCIDQMFIVVIVCYSLVTYKADSFLS